MLNIDFRNLSLVTGKSKRSIEKMSRKKSEKTGTKRQFLEHPMPYGHGGGGGGYTPYHGGE